MGGREASEIVDAHSLVRPCAEGERLRDDLSALLEEPDGDRRRRVARIGEQEVVVPERAGRTFGEVVGQRSGRCRRRRAVVPDLRVRSRRRERRGVHHDGRGSRQQRVAHGDGPGLPRQQRAERARERRRAVAARGHVAESRRQNVLDHDVGRRVRAEIGHHDRVDELGARSGPLEGARHEYREVGGPRADRQRARSACIVRQEGIDGGRHGRRDVLDVGPIANVRGSSRTRRSRSRWRSRPGWATCR